MPDMTVPVGAGLHQYHEYELIPNHPTPVSKDGVGHTWRMVLAAIEAACTKVLQWEQKVQVGAYLNLVANPSID